MNEKVKWPDGMSFPNIKQKVPVISTEELLSGESTEELIVSLAEGLVKHAKQVGFIDSEGLKDGTVIRK